MKKVITVEPKVLEWQAFRPDGDRRSVEHVAAVLLRWANRHARHRRLLHTPAQVEYVRDPEHRGTLLYAFLEYAEVPPHS